MLFSASERAFAAAIGRLAYTNPFEPDEIARHEQTALAIDLPAEVKARLPPLRRVAERPNIPVLLQRAEALVEAARQRVQKRPVDSEAERLLYEDLALFVLYFCYRDRLQTTLEEALLAGRPKSEDSAASGRGGGVRVKYFREFARDLEHSLAGTGAAGEAAHLFACHFQIRRAFQLIHARIIGQSRPAARLRAAVWQSIFTHDMRRYRDHLHARMHDITTLITGPSGTGKDLVAEAIGLSRYIRFDPATGCFEEDLGGAFHPVNLSALSPELIESELFGHCKGAFTGAVRDRLGWLEVCAASHSVFLDEVGELSPTIQVKLLRALHNRAFQRVGETRVRRFEGKVIAATNRDLDVEVREGRFRRDFYYRLCSDLIRTPALHEQVRDNPDALPHLVEVITRRLYGDGGAELAKEVVAWIDGHLGAGYTWPGNIRELEQCIRNVLVRKEYHPLMETAGQPVEDFWAGARELRWSADEMLRCYCTLVYLQTGSYLETARRLQLDRRTVKRNIDETMLERLRGAN